MNLSELKKLVKIFESSLLSKLEFEQEGTKIVLQKDLRTMSSDHEAPPSWAEIPLATSPNPIGAPAIAETAFQHVTEDEKPNSKNKIITSPMVGTFYKASSPTALPFVSEGTVIHPGKTLCIIEAMKLMNEIESEIKGEVIKIFPENGDPVEFGEPLFEILPS
ncbi:MAG: acetyl-CoA carboxylase biotin carboxyl carrier protein [Nitrospinota bacterium]